MMGGSSRENEREEAPPPSGEEVLLLASLSDCASGELGCVMSKALLASPAWCVNDGRAWSELYS